MVLMSYAEFFSVNYLKIFPLKMLLWNVLQYEKFMDYMKHIFPGNSWFEIYSNTSFSFYYVIMKGDKNSDTFLKDYESSGTIRLLNWVLRSIIVVVSTKLRFSLWLSDSLAQTLPPQDAASLYTEQDLARGSLPQS